MNVTDAAWTLAVEASAASLKALDKLYDVLASGSEDRFSAMGAIEEAHAAHAKFASFIHTFETDNEPGR